MITSPKMCPQALPRYSQKRRKEPTAYISVSGNADHEEDTALRKYIDFINELRHASNAPPLTLYSSMLGPRIKDQFHVYDPITETICLCTLKNEAEQFEIANHDERALLAESLRDRVLKYITRAVSRTQMNPYFKNDVAPQVLYVNPANLRRVQSPVLLSNLQSLSVPSHSHSDEDNNVSLIALALHVADKHQHLPDLPAQLLDPSNVWSLANLKSSILLIRFTKVLNRIRRQKLELPPYTVYWTAATRNKQLHNPRLGLILWDPVTSELLYTGSPSDSYSEANPPACSQESMNEGQTMNLTARQCATGVFQPTESPVASNQHRNLESFLGKMLTYIRANQTEKLALEEELEQQFCGLVGLMKEKCVPITARGPAMLYVANSKTMESKAEDWIAMADQVNLKQGIRCKTCYLI